MSCLLLAMMSLLLVASSAHGTLNPQGVKCGQKRCSTREYCSPYDAHCRPCAEACDTESRNYQHQECANDCQEYLHDQRYVLRAEWSQHQALRGEVERLRNLVTVSITLACLSLAAPILYLLTKTLLRWEKLGGAFRRSFTRTWAKKTSNKNKVRDDAEVGGAAKQNGLKLTMPTISASVASARCGGNGNGPDIGNGNGNGNGSGTGSGNGNGTPNTTSTPLSRRHPSEDTTLDYAYDNPAMTPSPEAAQLRTKRESSF